MPDPQNPPSSSGTGGAPLTLAKLALRDQIVTARNRRGLAEIGEAARAIAEHLLACAEIRRAATVASYVSIGTEPGTGPLLEALHDAGKRIVLPCLLPDDDLDWAVYDGDLVPARRGLLEPSGTRLGRRSVGTADAVLVPGLAVDRAGYRLGRGGGSYDRALGRVPLGTFTCVLLYDTEVGVPVPVEAHDRPVMSAASPAGIARLR